eukprot:gene7305-8121_t
MELDLERFSKSASLISNSNEKKQKASRSCSVAWSIVVTGILALMLCAGVFYVFHSDSRESSFDELITTGGAVRSLPSGVQYDQTVCNTKNCSTVAKYVKSCMDEKVDPCVDFFQYACGGWIKKNPIPKTSSTFSTFSKLNQQIEKILRQILESENKEDTNVLRKVKKFYKSCIDMKAINKKGDLPMKKLIEYLGSWPMTTDSQFDEEKWDLFDVLLHIHQKFTSSGGPLFSVHVSDDPVHNEKHIIEIDQAGPSLPREIYFDKPETLKAYEEYLVDVAKLLGAKDGVEKQANETVKFEKQLAEISVRDDDKTDTWFHSMTIEELAKAVPDFPWLQYINEVFDKRTKIKKTETIIVPTLKYLKKMMSVVNKTPKKVLANYIVWSIIQDEVPYLSSKFLTARMHYKEKILGSKGMRKRWKTCVSYTNEYLGEILGALYINQRPNQKYKNIAEDMIKKIRAAFKDNVKTLDWMDEKTKKAVEEKADAMRDQVGFPKYIHNHTRFEHKYHKLNIVQDDLFENRMQMIKFAHNRMLNKIRKKVDKDEWPMDPQTVNAMYSFNENGMIIPAGILQPPFFHGEDISMAMTYGAIGAILGHELSHGFDNTGRKFNKHGELKKQWWTDKSLKSFKQRSKCMQEQYSKYKVRDKYPINGKLTLGENIADNGGFKTSLRAYHSWLKETKKDNILPGLNFNNDQLFYLSFAQAYCSDSRPDEQYLATLNDRHTEEKFRVIGTLSNSREFAKAFKCASNTPMNPKKKCFIWVSDKTEIDK